MFPKATWPGTVQSFKKELVKGPSPVPLSEVARLAPLVAKGQIVMLSRVTISESWLGQISAKKPIMGVPSASIGRVVASQQQVKAPQEMPPTPEGNQPRSLFT